MNGRKALQKHSGKHFDHSDDAGGLFKISEIGYTALQRAMRLFLFGGVKTRFAFHVRLWQLIDVCRRS